MRIYIIENSTLSSFRKDINGLRAIAVIAVVLFHFKPAWLSGGFAGVDVFFVISGFLMTGIIFRGIEQDNFSILKFYVARANRIIPALALLCLALLIFGWFYLTPLEYRALGKHAASSIGFLSNIIYFTEAGYFDALSSEKWLLHTWSLSVEWQFYIVYPLVLLAFKRVLSLNLIKISIILLTVLGFLFSVYATSKWPNASYYLFPMRAWEMTLGGVAFLYPFKTKEINKKIVEMLGLVLILSSYVFISSDVLWPGSLALIPVLGAFLVIQAQRNNSFITGSLILQKLGLWSYSIYLWHWPFVVVIYVFSLPSQYLYIGIFLSVLFGFLSYNYIERIEFSRSFSSLLDYFKLKQIYIAGLVFLLGGVVFIYQSEISKIRYDGSELLIAEQEVINQASCSIDAGGCIYGDQEVGAIVIGDSHALSNMQAISERAKINKTSILGFGKSGCPTIEDFKQDASCSEFVKKALEIVSTLYPDIPVIIINRGSVFHQGSYLGASTDELKDSQLKTYCKFSESNPVYLVRATPEYELNIPRAMLRNANVKFDSLNISRVEHNLLKSDYHKVQDEAKSFCHDIKILDPSYLLCDNLYCYPHKDGIPLYYDDDHLSFYGSRLVAPIFDEVFQR